MIQWKAMECVRCACTTQRVTCVRDVLWTSSGIQLRDSMIPTAALVSRVASIMDSVILIMIINIKKHNAGIIARWTSEVLCLSFASLKSSAYLYILGVTILSHQFSLQAKIGWIHCIIDDTCFAIIEVVCNITGGSVMWIGDTQPMAALVKMTNCSLLCKVLLSCFGDLAVVENIRVKLGPYHRLAVDCTIR